MNSGMTAEEVVQRFVFVEPYFAKIHGNVLVIRKRWHTGWAAIVAELPIVNGEVDAGYISYLLSEAD